MRTLLKKESIALLCSSVAIIFCIVFLVATGLINWFFSGSFNIPESGYASLDKFFSLSVILLIILIPALTMRSFAEERRTKMLDTFRARPVSITSLYISKFIAICFVIFLTLLATTVYIYTLWVLSNPPGNIDLNEIISSYISLFFISAVFVSVGLFASSLTHNQVVALIIAIFLNFIIFYGFDLLGSIFADGKVKLIVSSLGLNSHYSLMQKGVIRLKDILVIVNYVLLFSSLAVYILNFKNKRNLRFLILVAGTVMLVNVLLIFVPNIRFDFTSDKRYTLSDYSKDLLDEIARSKEDIHLKIFLEGELNPGFQRLQNGVKDIVADFNHYADGRIIAEYINPHNMGNHQAVYDNMQKQGMHGIVLTEKDREGKVSQKVIYPYAQMISKQDTLLVNLLMNVAGYSAEENLNASAENLEFAFIDALRLLNKKEAEEIAFIEGHGEIPRAYVYDAEELLSKYFFVNRGQIGLDISVLDNFKVVIIAGPTEKFSEQEKFILDQYIMSGGRVLWLIDGVYLSEKDLAEKGESASMKNEVNLDDMLFIYGVRINPVLVQDAQCTSIMLASGDGSSGDLVKMPLYYSPLLLPSYNNAVTKDISAVKALFASYLDVTDKDTPVKKTVLLTTSAQSHSVKVPEMVNFDISQIQENSGYFDQSYLPVAIALDGTFKSVFTNRMMPDSIQMDSRIPGSKSIDTKMIVVSSSDIIRNQLVNSNQQTEVLPMGYDRVSDRQYGNRDFIVNAVNWLANDDDWLLLRNKQQQIRLLDKQLVYEQRDKYAIINIIFPVIFVTLFIGLIYLWRKRKYEK